MRGLKVRGLACPYDSRNCYDEMMAPGAFDAFLQAHGGVRAADGQIEADDMELPMHFMHEGRQIGTWERLWTTSEGLWCEGFVTDPMVALLIETEQCAQLSVTWMDGGDQGKVVTNK